MRISEVAMQHLLSTWPVARLATMNVDGSPHQVPIVYVWHNGRFWSPIDGKPKQKTQLTRIDNLIANPKASLLIDRYDDDWSLLWWIRADLEVTVMRLTEAGPEALKALNLVKKKLEDKYPQYRDTPVLQGSGTILSMHATAFASWRG
jgi:PPOX class probable F420-dependent enzyme|tara:strand:- start:52 stop:495 length:444 start_codon:yes stop_codon:yes gene_type:complete